MKFLELGNSENIEKQPDELPIFLVKGLKNSTRNMRWNHLANKLNLIIVLLYERTIDGCSGIVLDYKAPTGVRENDLFEKYNLVPERMIDPESLMGALKYFDLKYHNEQNIALVLDEKLLNKKIEYTDTNEILSVRREKDKVNFSLFGGAGASSNNQKPTLELSISLKILIDSQELADDSTIAKIKKFIDDIVEGSKYLKGNSGSDEENELVFQLNDEKKFIGATGLYYNGSGVYGKGGELLFEYGKAKYIILTNMAKAIDTDIRFTPERIVEILGDKFKYSFSSIPTVISEMNGIISSNLGIGNRHIIVNVNKKNKNPGYYIEDRKLS